jgi:hypothetical protein
MQYYNVNNTVHALDDGVDPAEYIKQPFIAISKAEADILSAPPPLTAQQQQELLEQSVQNHMDEQAKLKGYDSILSACSYAAAPNQFQVESKSFLTWRAACWAYCYQVQANVIAGTQPMPTALELIAGLPARV